MVQVNQAELKQAVIESIGSHQLAKGAGDNRLNAQSDHKEVSDCPGENELHAKQPAQ
jgi:hypothetical protein